MTISNNDTSTATEPTHETPMHHNSTPINPLPELAPVLKQLRLSGIIESLDQRNRQAMENKMTYPEFLALVIQDEAAGAIRKNTAPVFDGQASEGTKQSRALTLILIPLSTRQ